MSLNLKFIQKQQKIIYFIKLTERTFWFCSFTNWNSKIDVYVYVIRINVSFLSLFCNAFGNANKRFKFKIGSTKVKWAIKLNHIPYLNEKHTYTLLHSIHFHIQQEKKGESHLKTCASMCDCYKQYTRFYTYLTKTFLKLSSSS